MRSIFSLLLLVILLSSANAQSTVPAIQPYGKVDQADLEMKDCDFEKGANGMVLFDQANAIPQSSGRILILSMERHVRLKIFNDFGKNLANVRIEYFSDYLNGSVISGLQAETINLNNGKIEVTPLDKKLVYTEKIDRFRSVLIFAFPNVKSGSVVEYKYHVTGPSLPIWYFQNYIPSRYSEIAVNIPGIYNFKSIPHTHQAYVKSVGESTDAYQLRAMVNIHSMPNEPYIGSREDNLQRIEFLGINTQISTWPKIGEFMLKFNAFGSDMDGSLNNEAEIIKKAKSLVSDDEKIRYIFAEVKSRMKWDGKLQFYAVDGSTRAWDRKSGNSAEINIIVWHLLKKAGIKAYPLVVCTKRNGKINPSNPTLFLFNNTVVYVPVDSTKTFVLDASRKENLYNMIPANILNTFGLSIDPKNIITIDETEKSKAFNMVFISNEDPIMQSVSLNAEVTPDGNIEGNAEITSYGYNKINALRLYDTLGEAKYIDSLQKKNKDVKMSSFKIESAEVDSLPLSQKFNFHMDLPASDGSYIYFTTNALNVMGKNPFFNEARFSDIDFGYRDNYALYGVYKLPAGYKIDALPKTISIMMPDQSMIFKRTIAQDNGTILVKYVLNHKKTLYFKEDYGDVRSFYSKMYELLNEQIVLKKS